MCFNIWKKKFYEHNDEKFSKYPDQFTSSEDLAGCRTYKRHDDPH